MDYFYKLLFYRFMKFFFIFGVGFGFVGNFIFFLIEIRIGEDK